MTTTALVPIPRDEIVFEDNCAILAKSVFSDPNASTFAEKGYKQFGIDILAYRNGNPKQIVGVQCKLKTKGQPPTETEIRKELTKLEGFEHELDSFYIWHTANDSTDLEKLAVTLTKELAGSGKQTKVFIWGWRKLSSLISQGSDALRAFSPDQTAVSDKILQKLADLSSADESLDATLSGIKDSVGRLEQSFEAVDVSIDGEELGTYHTVVDQFANLLKSGQAQTALNLLHNLEKTFNSQTPKIVRFRVRANIGHALSRLGRHEEGSVALRESMEFAPNTAKAWQTKAIAEANLDKFDNAFEILNKGLKEFPEDAELISLYLQIAARSSNLDDPWSIVPDHLVDSEHVQYGVTDYLRVKGDTSWRELAKKAFKQHSDSKSLNRAAAEAIFEEAIEKYGGQETVPNDDELSEAAQRLQNLHDAAVASEERGFAGNLVVGCNLATAYRLMGKYKMAGKVADELLPFVDDLPFIVESVVPAFSGLSRYEECKELIQKMPDGRDKIMLTIETYLALGEFDALLGKVDSTTLDGLSPEDRVQAKSALLLAREAIDATSISAEELAELVSTEPKNIDALAAAAGIYSRKGEKESADKAFEDALGLISENSTRVDRYNLARPGQELGRWTDVIDLLSGYTVFDTQTDDLRRLATAYVYISRHPDAEPFFDKALEAHPDSRDLLRKASHQAFNKGDLERAERLSKELLAKDPYDADAHMVCVNIFRRLDKSPEIVVYIAPIELDKLTGSIGDKLSIAAACVRHGRESDGFQLAYDLTIQNMNDPAVIQFFTTLIFMMEPQLAAAAEAPSSAEVESCVEFLGPDGEQSILITSGASQLAHDIVNAKEGRAQALIGASPGDVIDLPIGRKRSIQVEVKAVQHRYLGLARSILRNFERRYSSGANGMYSIQTQGGDVQPILDEIREISEADLESARTYTEGVVPLFVVARYVRGNVIDFAGYLALHDKEIVSCIGTLEERNAAVEQIQESKGKGVTLDTITFWVLCEIGQFDAVKQYFGEVNLPQSTVDDLVSYRERHRPRDDKPAMSVGYVDGEFFREEVPAERLNNFIDQISERIQIAQEQCTIVAATLPKNARTADLELLDQQIGHGLDAAYVSISKSNLLLSDDFHYRQLAQQIGVEKSTWLQPLLLILLETGGIDAGVYRKSTTILAARRHRYISVRSSDLQVAVTAGQPTEEFRILAKLIGSPDAEIRSHIRVVTEFGTGLKDLDFPKWARLGHLGLLIDELIKHRKEDWRDMLDALIAIFQQSGNSELADYVVGWARGHFLPL